MDDNIKTEDALFLIKRFHGHIGPYVVLGYRAGLIANRELGEESLNKRAHTMTGFKTPVSCFTDGVQLGSCCTLGKGNITVSGEGEARVRFTLKDGSRSVEVSLSRETLERIQAVEDWEAGERLGCEMFAEPEERLFTIKIDDRLQGA